LFLRPVKYSRETWIKTDTDFDFVFQINLSSKV